MTQVDLDAIRYEANSKRDDERMTLTGAAKERR